MFGRLVVRSSCQIRSRPFSTRSSRLDAAKYTTSLNIFDRETKRKQKNLTCAHPDYKQFEYVKEEIGYRIADRVFDIKRSFDNVLDLGCQRGYVTKHITKVCSSLYSLKIRIKRREKIFGKGNS